MKKIWLVRHGQSLSQSTEDNDVVDPELSELGRQQARRLVKPLQNFELDLILISPLRRAWQTYQLSGIQNSRWLSNKSRPCRRASKAQSFPAASSWISITGMFVARKSPRN